jgi:hypothetical protein
MLGIAVIVVAIVLVLVSFSQRVFSRTNIKHLNSTSPRPPSRRPPLRRLPVGSFKAKYVKLSAQAGRQTMVQVKQIAIVATRTLAYTTAMSTAHGSEQ